MTSTTPPIVFLDTETDGLHPDRRVWEVAMIRRDGHTENSIEFFIDIALDTANPESLAIGRFYDRHPVGRWLTRPDDSERPESYEPEHNMLLPWDATQVVARWTHGAHIVGSVPNFDTEVLGNLLRQHDLTPAWHYHLIDVENLAVGWLHGLVHAHNFSKPLACAEHDPFPCLTPAELPTNLPYRSDDLSRACGVEPPTAEQRHTAMGDARWAQRMYDKITGHDMLSPAVQRATFDAFAAAAIEADQ